MTVAFRAAADISRLLMNIPHPFAFDPTYGQSPEDLLQATLDDPAPSDFDTFWSDLRTRARAVPLGEGIQELPSLNERYRLLLVEYRCYPDYRVGAWAIIPRDLSGVRFGRVVGHGYGGREGPDWEHADPSRAVLFPVVPGFQISGDPRLPFNDSSKHVVHGIEKRETYVLGSCAAAFWSGPDVLATLLPDADLKFHYVGWSFGGGIGTLMLPWEPRYETAEIGEPTFGNHPFRLRHECAGSGEAVRQLWQKRPEIAETLRYFDAVFAARRLTIPVVYACSQFDPAVPPPGQFSVFNAHAGPKRLSPFTSGHIEESLSDRASEQSRHQQNLRELLGSAATG